MGLVCQTRDDAPSRRSTPTPGAPHRCKGVLAPFPDQPQWFGKRPSSVVLELTHDSHQLKQDWPLDSAAEPQSAKQDTAKQLVKRGRAEAHALSTEAVSLAAAESGTSQHGKPRQAAASWHAHVHVWESKG